MTTYNKIFLTVIIAVSSLTNLSAMYEPERRPNREQQELDRAIALSLQDQWGFVGQDEGHNRQDFNNNNNIDEDLREALEASAREEQRAILLNHEQEELERALKLSEQESKAKANQDKLDKALYDLVKNMCSVVEVQDLINQGADVNISDQDALSTPLMWAASHGLYEIGELLLKNGADVNVQNGNGNTALYFAAQWNWAGVAKLLIDNGAVISIQTNKGWTALCRAAYKGHLEICELLIDSGADVNAKTNIGGTALIWTVRKGHLAVCKALIENGADVNAKTNIGDTALIWAVYRGFLDVCSTLIENGAAFNIINNKQKSALSIAAKKGKAELCKLIIENACWACPSKDEVDISRARLKEFLLCMNRLTKKSKVPKDIKFLIFQSQPELERDFVHVLYYDLCQGKQIGNWMDVLKNRVADYTLGELKLFMDCATLDLGDANQELKSILDSTVLEKNFGKVIRTNINERLGLMNAQAQEK